MFSATTAGNTACMDRSATPSPASATELPLKVFLAEDSAALRARLAALLQTFGFVDVVGQAASVHSAIDGIRGTHAQAAILDFQLEGGTALDILRAVGGAQALHVAVLTHFTQEPYRKACLEAGAEHFLDKHEDFTRLHRIVMDWHHQLQLPAGLPNKH